MFDVTKLPSEPTNQCTPTARLHGHTQEGYGLSWNNLCEVCGCGWVVFFVFFFSFVSSSFPFFFSSLLFRVIFLVLQMIVLFVCGILCLLLQKILIPRFVIGCCSFLVSTFFLFSDHYLRPFYVYINSSSYYYFSLGNLQKTYKGGGGCCMDASS